MLTIAISLLAGIAIGLGAASYGCMVLLRAAFARIDEANSEADRWRKIADDEVAILRRAADIYKRHGDRSEPGRLVPTWLRGCAHVLAEQRRIPTAEELAAREEWDRLKLAEARHA